MSDGGYFHPTPMVRDVEGILQPVTAYGDFGGVTIRDWLAAHETLADFDHPDVTTTRSMTEALAGPMPEHGFNAKTKDEWIAMLTWEATWKAKLKFIRADAMLAARNSKI